MLDDVNYRSLFDLSGRVAVVTGACGTLGPGFCQGLAEFGAAVAVVDVAADKPAALAAELSERFGITARGYQCDVSDTGAVDAMAAQVEADFGRIDILHNNHQSAVRDPEAYFRRFEDYDPEEWRRVMSIDLDGMFLVARAVGGRIAAGGRGGAVIQVSSIYGSMAPDNRIYAHATNSDYAINTPAVYAANKAGVQGLTRWLATYWAEQGVRVNTLVPGGVRGAQNDEFVAAYSNRVPLARMGRKQDMVGALLWLASDASAYVTGQAIHVDGGLSAW